MFFDEKAELRLLAAFIDDQQQVLKVTQELFTNERKGLFIAFQECYKKYGYISSEGVELVYNRSIPPELEMARGAQVAPIIDYLKVLATKRQLADLSNNINMMLNNPRLNIDEVQSMLTLKPLSSSDDSSINPGIAAFVHDLQMKQSGEYRFIDTGLKFLNHMLGGEWPRGAMTVLAAASGSGKCYDGDVYRSDGTSVHISQIKPGDCVLSLDEDTMKIVESKVDNVVCTGVQDSYIVHTTRGLSTRTSSVHPYLTQRGWVRTCDLRIGDYIATVRKSAVWKDEDTYSDSLVKVLAYLIGDGNLHKHLAFSKANKVIIDDFTQCLCDIGCSIRKTPGDNVDYGVSGGDLRKFIRSIGLDVKSCDKFIPDFIMSASNRQLSLFLGALYATDGWLCAKEAGGTEVGYATTSKKLAEQLVQLLSRFGVVASIRAKQGKYEKDGVVHVCKLCYQITFGSRQQVLNFCEYIHVIGKEDAQHRCHLAALNSAGNDDSDVIPRERVPSVELYHKHGGVRVSRLIRDGLYPKEAYSDVFWTRVRDVEKIPDVVMWDLEIEGTHNFVGNGVILHNTSLVCTSLLNMARKGIPVSFYSLEMPKKRIVPRLVANIAEVDGLALRTGKITEEERARVDLALEEIQSLPFYFNDTTERPMSLNDILYYVQQHRYRYGIEAFFVDYLQIIADDGDDEKQVSTLGRFTQQLRDIAVKEDIASIVLSQQNRANTGIASLLGSGRIGHIADVVILMKLADTVGEYRLAEIAFEKNRDGPTGQACAMYNGKYLRFIDS